MTDKFPPTSKVIVTYRHAPMTHVFEHVLEFSFKLGVFGMRWSTKFKFIPMDIVFDILIESETDDATEPFGK